MLKICQFDICKDIDLLINGFVRLCFPSNPAKTSISETFIVQVVL